MAENKQPQATAQSLIDLADPDIGWARISQGMGVPAAAVSTAEDLIRELGTAFNEPGPHLIEVIL